MLDQHYFKKTLLIASWIVAILSPEVLAQVIGDDTLPTPTVVNISEQKFKISQGTQRGSNLFHSLQEFSLQKEQVAHFDNLPAGISNIITRITGNKVSQIDGTIKSNGSANLFFLNPNGIIFGKNARLDIGGSFIATTATRISFGDGQEFGVSPQTSTSILSMAVPTGLQFGLQPQPIVNRSQAGPLNIDNFPSGLSVKDGGNTIVLLGGDLRLEGGNVNAFAGRIDLGSVGSQSFVKLLPDSQGWQLDYANVNSFQDIRIVDSSTINASGDNGTINLQGRQILIADGSRITNLALRDMPEPGPLYINATELVQLVNGALINTAPLDPQSDPDNPDFSVLTTPLGKIIINTHKLIIESGAAIQASNFGNAQQGGNVEINALESVDIVGVGLREPSLIVTTAINSPNSPGKGVSGDIEINTKILTVANGGQINSGTNNSGQGGTITINAAESVIVTGIGTFADGEDSPSKISTDSGFTFDTQSGNAGDIEINTPQLRIENNALISSDSILSPGEAGTIKIQAQSLNLNSAGTISTNSDSGSGGNISIVAKDSLTLLNQSEISAEAGIDGRGTGGNIDIKTTFIFAVPRENSHIQANALGGTGGNINIQASGIFGIQQRPAPTPLSDITATGRNETQSGQINITRPEIDPESGLLNQDTEVLDTKGLIVQTCGAGGKFASGEFIMTGRGGLPPDPVENVSMPEALPDLGVQQSPHSPPSPAPAAPQIKKTSQTTTIVEAQGWRVNSAGELELFATGEATPKNLPHPCLPEDYQLSYN
jgi:filamentous hemagglutinin family protein